MFRISLSASDKGWNYNIDKLPYKKTPKGYAIERDCTTKRLKDSDLGVSSSYGRDSVDYIHRYMFCLDEANIKENMANMYEEITGILIAMRELVNKTLDYKVSFDNLIVRDNSKPIEKITITDDMF